MACPDARSIPETAGHDDRPLQSSIGDRQFGCSGANADALLGAFQNCQAITQAQCQVAFLFIPLSHKSMCHPYRCTGWPHT